MSNRDAAAVDSDVIDLELDDELFNSPVAADNTASAERSSTFATTNNNNNDGSSGRGGGGVDALRVSGIDFDLSGGGGGPDSSRGSTPTEAALAARAKIEEARKAAVALGDGGGSGEVTGSMLGTAVDDDDDESSADEDDDDEAELEVFDGAVAAAAATSSKPPPKTSTSGGSAAAKDAFGEEDVAFEMVIDDDDDDAEKKKKKPSASASADAAIAAIDAIAATSAAAAASQKSVDKLTEKFVDKFDLEIDESGGNSVLKTGSSVAGDDSAAGGGDDDEFEEEFGYAFEGKKREGKTHKHEFKAKPMPQNLVTNVKSMPMMALAEDEEEEEEEEEEEVEMEGSAGAAAAAARAAEEAAAFEAATRAAEVEAEEARKSEAAAKAAAATKPEDSAAAAMAAAAAARAKREAAAEKKKKIAAAAAAKTPAAAAAAAAASAATPADPAAAADEWDQVNAVRADEEKTAVAGVGGQVVQLLSPVTYLEAKRYFMTLDISPYRHELHVEDEPGGCCGCLAPKLKADIAKDRETMFGMAKIKLDDDDQMHLRVLHTIYMRLMGGARAMPRFGSHWEDVGFQGSDPATDLRGYSNASAIHKLSRDTIQEFPMAPLSINLTHIALKAVRKGLLTAEANKLGSMWKAADNFYCGAFYEFYLRWKSGGKTIVDSGHVKRELEDFLLTAKGAKHALDISENARLGQAGSTPASSSGGGKKASSGLEFQDF